VRAVEEQRDEIGPLLGSDSAGEGHRDLGFETGGMSPHHAPEGAGDQERDWFFLPAMELHVRWMFQEPCHP
jgi:hypothetical protein